MAGLVTSAVGFGCYDNRPGDRPAVTSRTVNRCLPSPFGRGAGGEGRCWALDVRSSPIRKRLVMPRPSPQPSPRGRGSQNSREMPQWINDSHEGHPLREVRRPLRGPARRRGAGARAGAGRGSGPDDRQPDQPVRPAHGRGALRRPAHAPRDPRLRGRGRRRQGRAGADRQVLRRQSGRGPESGRGELGRVRHAPGAPGGAGRVRPPRRAGRLVLRQPGHGPGDGPARPGGPQRGLAAPVGGRLDPGPDDDQAGQARRVQDAERRPPTRGDGRAEAARGRRGDLLGRRPDRRAGPRGSSAARGSATPSTRLAATPAPASSTRWRPAGGCSSTGRWRRPRSGSTPGR